MKIWFFWTWDFSGKILKDLIENNDVEIAITCSQIDKPIWRKKEIIPTKVKQISNEFNIEVIQPTKLKDEELFNKLKSLNLDFIVVVAYWKIIPREILEIPKYWCINIHWSILPKYRGASPIQESLKNWDTKTWLTIMYMSEWMDEWDILKIEEISVDILDKTQDIFNKFEKIWANILVETLKKIIKNEIIPTKQNENNASYCSKILKTDWEISFENNSSFDIYNKFRAYSNWPGIYTYYKWKKLEITDCFFDDHEVFFDNDFSIWDVVEIWNDNEMEIWILCKSWTLILKKVKLEGKKETNIKDFLNGNKDFLDYNFIN